MLLVNPPSPYMIEERVFPHLGIMYVATALKNKGVDVKVLDLLGDKDWKNTIKNTDESIYGFTASSASFPYVYEMNQIVKQKKARTIIGGSHPTAIASLREKGIYDINTKRLEEFDVIVNGEIEDGLEKGGKWAKGKLTDIVNNSIIPDRSFVDIHSYKYKIDNRDATILLTQRGCPFKCEFCCGRNLDMYKTPRQRKPEDVVKEMDYLNKEFGYSAFMWFDDEINVNKDRLIETAKLLTKRDYKHRGFLRGDLLVKHPEILDYLKDAGFVELCSGAESGSNRILKVINKGTTNEINLKAAELIKSKGFRYKVFTIIGHPSETYQDVRLTRKFLEDSKPDSFDVTILTPYPGSKIYDGAKKSERFIYMDYEYKGLYFNKPDFALTESYYKGIPGQYKCNSRTDELSMEDIITLREEISRPL